MDSINAATNVLYCSNILTLLITLWWAHDIESLSWLPFKWNTTTWVKHTLKTDQTLIKTGISVGVLNIVLFILNITSGFYLGVFIIMLPLFLMLTGLAILLIHSSVKKYVLKKRTNNS